MMIKLSAFIGALKEIWQDIQGLSLAERLLFLICMVVFLLVLAANLAESWPGPYALLAQSFLRGKLHFVQPMDEVSGIIDATLWKGKIYWPAGPVPALLSLPFVSVLGNLFKQGFLKFLLNIYNFFLLVALCRRLGVKSGANALLLVFGYAIATSYTMVGAAPVSVYLAQVVATTFLLMALLEFLNRKRWWLIGLYTAALFGTRGNLLLAVIPFLLLIFFEQKELRPKLFSTIQFIVPVATALLLYFFYNYARFGSIWETGYSFQSWVDPTLAAIRDTWGLFSIRYLPANIYYFLLKGPEMVFSEGLQFHARFPFIKASPWGMSIVLTSPIFLFSLKSRMTSRVIIIWLGIIAILFSNFLYHGIGRLQYGYRYALDVYPLLFYLSAGVVAQDEKRYVRWLKYFVLFGLAANLWLALPLYIMTAI